MDKGARGDERRRQDGQGGDDQVACDEPAEEVIHWARHDANEQDDLGEHRGIENVDGAQTAQARAPRALDALQ